MKYSKQKANPDVFELILKLNEKMSEIQSGINAVYEELSEAEAEVSRIRSIIFSKKPELSNFAELRAALASSASRRKYFFGHTEADIIKMAKAAV